MPSADDTVSALTGFTDALVIADGTPSFDAWLTAPRRVVVKAVRHRQPTPAASCGGA